MKRPPFWLIAGGGLLAAVILVALRPQGVSVVQAVLGVGILAVGSTPMLVFFWDRHPAPIPIFPVASLFYVVCFGLPVFLADMIWPQANGTPAHYDSVIASSRSYFLNIQALALVLAGVALSTAFYYLAMAVFPRRMPRLTLPRSDDKLRLVILFGLLLCGHLAYLFIPFVQTLPSIGQFLGPAVYLSFGGLYWLWRDGRLSRRYAFLIFGVILPIVILKKLAGGLMSPVILIGLFFFFLMSFFRNRTALIIAALCAGLVVVGYGPMMAFRVGTWHDPHFKTYSLSEKLEHAFDYQKPGLSLERKLASSAGMVLQRVAFLAMFSRVVDQTPEKVPYWQGVTYKPLLTSYIPRALWPGKPEERAGNTFGIRYGFIHDSMTSMNMPWIVEMFVNFGTLGVLAGMSLVGVFLAFLDRTFNRPDTTPLEAVVGLTIIFPLAYPESNFSEMTGSLLLLTLSLWVYFRVGLTAFPNLEDVLARICRR